MTLLNTCALTIFTVMLACGQVLFKQVGLALQGHSGPDAMLLVMRQPTLYAALILYGAATLLWIWILSRVTLVQAYPWVSLGTIIVPLLGWLVFGERVIPLFWLGVALIIAGLGLTQYAAALSRIDHAANRTGVRLVYQSCQNSAGTTNAVDCRAGSNHSAEPERYSEPQVG